MLKRFANIFVGMYLCLSYFSKENEKNEYNRKDNIYIYIYITIYIYYLLKENNYLQRRKHLIMIILVYLMICIRFNLHVDISKIIKVRRK